MFTILFENKLDTISADEIVREMPTCRHISYSHLNRDIRNTQACSKARKTVHILLKSVIYTLAVLIDIFLETSIWLMLLCYCFIAQSDSAAVISSWSMNSIAVVSCLYVKTSHRLHRPDNSWIKIWNEDNGNSSKIQNWNIARSKWLSLIS